MPTEPLHPFNQHGQLRMGELERLGQEFAQRQQYTPSGAFLSSPGGEVVGLPATTAPTNTTFNYLNDHFNYANSTLTLDSASLLALFNENVSGFLSIVGPNGVLSIQTGANLQFPGTPIGSLALISDALGDLGFLAPGPVGQIPMSKGPGVLPGYVALSGDVSLDSTGVASLATTGVTAATYGDATHTVTLTVDAKGRLTAASANAIPDFVASGASHAHGLVPDPGSTAGTTRFLREDATWAAPAGGGGATTHGARIITGSATVNAAGNSAVATGFSTDFDTDTYTATADRLTVPTGRAGKYVVCANAQWSASASGGSGYYEIQILKNNATGVAQFDGAFPWVEIAVELNLAATDFLQVKLINNTANNLTVANVSLSLLSWA